MSKAKKKAVFIIISGPQGCGKTRNARVLKDAYDCHVVLDDWAGGFHTAMRATGYANRRVVDQLGQVRQVPLSQLRVLVLTSVPIDELKQFCERAQNEGFDALFYCYEKAMRVIQCASATTGRSSPASPVQVFLVDAKNPLYRQAGIPPALAAFYGKGETGALSVDTAISEAATSMAQAMVNKMLIESFGKTMKESTSVRMAAGKKSTARGWVRKQGDLTIGFTSNNTVHLKRNEKYKEVQTFDLSADEVRLLAKLLMAELLK